MSNADIAPTLAHILRLDLSGNGHLVNRVAEEALAGEPASTPYQTGLKRSTASTSGMKYYAMRRSAMSAISIAPDSKDAPLVYLAGSSGRLG